MAKKWGKKYVLVSPCCLVIETEPLLIRSYFICRHTTNWFTDVTTRRPTSGVWATYTTVVNQLLFIAWQTTQHIPCRRKKNAFMNTKSHSYKNNENTAGGFNAEKLFSFFVTIALLQGNNITGNLWKNILPILWMPLPAPNPYFNSKLQLQQRSWLQEKQKTKGTCNSQSANMSCSVQINCISVPQKRVGPLPNVA